jgi:flagellin-like protein
MVLSGELMKGVSPLIASVLLIAFVIAVAGLYSGWITSFTKTTTEQVQEQSEKKVNCSYGGIALDNVKYNRTTGNMSGTVENTDLIGLGNIDFEIFYTNAPREKLDLNMNLEPGERNTFNNQVLNMNVTSYDKIRVITNCPNVYDEISSSDVSEVT